MKVERKTWFWFTATRSFFKPWWCQLISRCNFQRGKRNSMEAVSSWGNKNPDWDGMLGLNGSQDGLKGYLGNYFLFESGFSKFTVQSIKKSLELKHRKAFSFFFRVDLPWVKWIVVDGRWRLTASYWSQHSQCSSARTLLRIFFFPRRPFHSYADTVWLLKLEIVYHCVYFIWSARASKDFPTLTDLLFHFCAIHGSYVYQSPSSS